MLSTESIFKKIKQNLSSHTISRFIRNLTGQSTKFNVNWLIAAVAVALLGEQSLLVPEDVGSKPVTNTFC